MKIKYLSIYDDIRKSLSGDNYLIGDKLPTDEEYAQKYGVSIITIKKAMSLLVNDGYIERGSGKGTTIIELPKQQRQIISLIMPKFSEAFGELLVTNFEKKCRDMGYTPIVSLTFNDQKIESEIINEHLEMNTSGIIIIPVSDKYCNTNILSLALSSFPIVLIDREINELPINCILTDNYSATILLGEYLKGKNYSNVGIISTKSHDVRSTSLRQINMSEYLSKSMINFSLIEISNVYDFKDFTSYKKHYKDLYLRIKEFKKNNFESLFCVQYEIAILVNKICDSLDYYPEITCFDYLNSSIDIKYTHIQQDESALISKAVERLVDFKNGNKIITHELVEGTLIERNI